ncbi:MAG TPA: pentapeptide repeat-containing protein [Thermoanaerobaculia bacterium]|jgi:uncharacterized protein YjbI with pentapeptide repeats
MTVDEHTSLDATEQEARIAKLRAERDLLEAQLSKAYRRLEVLKAIGTPITAVVAVIGVLFSTTQWYFGNQAARAAQRQENIQHQLERLAATEPSERITAVASLKSALSGDDASLADQSVAALTDLLATESSFAVRNAIVSALSRIPTLSPEKRRAVALVELTDVSRGLVSEGKLWRFDRVSNASAETSSTTSRALSVSHAIAALLRQGTRGTSLAGIYLVGEDLTGLNLPAADFKGAILIGSRFDRAILNDSNFDDAVLAGTSFRNSRLGNASFRQPIATSGSDGRPNYVFDQILLLQHTPEAPVPIVGPTFDGADLTGATFEGHPLFPIYADDMHNHAIITGFSFSGARLTGVDLRTAWAFGVRRRDIHLSDCELGWYGPTLISFGGMPLEVVGAKVSNNPANIKPRVQCRRSFELIGIAFRDTIRSRGLSPNFLEGAVESTHYIVR